MHKQARLPAWPIAFLYVLWWVAFIGWVIISAPAQVAISTGDRYDPTRIWPSYLLWWQVATTALVIFTLMGAPVAVIRGIIQWRTRRRP
jgi:hypothetical protein